MGGEVLETSPPTFHCAINTTKIKSRSLKVETACMLPVSGVMPVYKQRYTVSVAIWRQVACYRSLQYLPPSLPVRWGSSIELQRD